MEAPKNKSSPLASTIRRVARILCILAIAFIGMWAVEAVEGKVGLGRQILGFLMAPPFLMSVTLIIILIIAWKRELVGGILIALIGLATAAYVYISTYHRFGCTKCVLNRCLKWCKAVQNCDTFGVPGMMPKWQFSRGI